MAATFDEIARIQIPVWDKVLRTVLVYGLIYVLMRLAKRDAAQLTASDFVVVLLLSNVVQNAIIGPDDSLLGGAVGAVTLIVVNELVARWELAQKKEGSERPGPLGVLQSVWAVRADQVRLIEDGYLREEALRGLGISRLDLFAELRRQGVGDPSRDVDWAEIRTGGTIDYKLKEHAEAATKGDVDGLHRELRELRDAVGRLSTSG